MGFLGDIVRKVKEETEDLIDAIFGEQELVYEQDTKMDISLRL